jgi:flagellin-specific chaperone FliS
MSEQAQFWEDSWDTGPSAARTPIWGNSFGVFHPARPAHDQFLPPLPVPSADVLRLGQDWRRENEKRLRLAGDFLAQNDELTDILEANLARVRFNRYNLEVYLSIANLCRQNLVMVQDLGRIADALKAAESAAARSDGQQAVAALDRAIGIAEDIRQYRNQTLQNTTDTWYQSWFPRVAKANGRKYLDKVDDVKDHQPMRTVDMSYLVYRELLYPLGDWANRVIAVRNQFASAHGLPIHEFHFDWKETSSVITTARTADPDE